MYRITIKTKYNTITLEREDYNTPEVQEILEQPYIEEIDIENLDKSKKLVKEKKWEGIKEKKTSQ